MSDLIDLYMIRHAAVLNPDNIIYGDAVDVDIEGSQPRLKELAEILPHPDDALWVHSGVMRAMLTAKNVLDHKQASHDDLITHSGFREQDFGDLIGQRKQDIDGHLRFIDGKIFAPNPPKGESLGELKERLLEALSDVFEIARDTGKDKIVIFTHGGAIRAARLVIEKLPLNDFIDYDTDPLCVYNP